MSNIHGFDFLRTEHNSSVERQIDTAAIVAAPQYSYDQNQNQHQPPSNKTDGEKIYDVIRFLKAHRTRGCLIPSIIFQHIGVDLSESGTDDNVRKHLCDNFKIRVEEIPDPDQIQKCL